MEVKDTLKVLDTICGIYRNSSKYPLTSDEPSRGEGYDLLEVGSIFDRDISTTHLSRPELVLLISDGSHGKNLVDYLYKECIFYRDKESCPNTSQYYYIYPCRDQNMMKIHRHWYSKGLDQSTYGRILESVRTECVMTDQEFMKVVSVFLLQLSNVAILPTNAFIVTMAQNKASLILVILQASSNEEDILKYHQTILSIVESGQMRKLHLYINFDLGDTNVQEVLEGFNQKLHDVFKGRHSYCSAKQLSFKPIFISSGSRLIEHLLGAKQTQLEHLYRYINGFALLKYRERCRELISEALIHVGENSVLYRDGGWCVDGAEECVFESVKDEVTASADVSGMEGVLSLFEDLDRMKVNVAIKRLDDDVNHLWNISNGLVNENRIKERYNTIANAQKYFQQFQSMAITILIMSTLMLHLIVLLFKSNIETKTDFVANLIRNNINKYSMMQWITFYVFILLYYYLFKFFGDRYLSAQTLDQSKYNTQKETLTYLEQVKHQLNNIKKTL